MEQLISVIICTHNPRNDYIFKVLESLKSQTLPKSQWELLLIDNASSQLLSSEINLTWHPFGRHIREEKLGLTSARLRGFQEATNETLVFVDDDNVLSTNYLENVAKIFKKNLTLGAIGGKSIPQFEIEPEFWFYEINAPLGLRDLGDEIKVCDWLEELTEEDNSPRQYPEFAPIGAGLVLRKQAAQVYAMQVTRDSIRSSLGRTGKELTSAEDNDIVLTLLEAGWGVGYFPQLQLTHLISASRLTKDYLARLNFASSRSWIQVLDTHGIRPWKKISRWSVLPRKMKAFLNYQPWKSPAAYVKWQGVCGMFEGLSNLS